MRHALHRVLEPHGVELPCWLQGMNGGPLLQPANKINDRQMAMLRRGLAEAKLKPTRDPDGASFAGRNPMPRATTAPQHAAE